MIFQSKTEKKSILEIPDGAMSAFEFELITEAQIRAQISRLAPSRAPGPDGIPSVLISS